VSGAAQVLSRGIITTPIGPLASVVEDRGVVALQFCVPGAETEAFAMLGAQFHANLLEDGHPLLGRLQRQVNAYFDGERQSFSVPLSLRGTPFQRKVWGALQQIAYGQTSSYHEIAELVGSPTANRAVAQACGSNPAPLLIPCHRVIATDGGLGGFSAGLDRKRDLLQLEQRVSPQLPLLQLVAQQELLQRQTSARENILEALPLRLKDWLETPDPLDRALPPSLWLNEAMTSLGPALWPGLAEVLADRGRALSDESLTFLGRDVTNLLAARWADSTPGTAELETVLRAAITTDAPSFALIVRQLLARGPVDSAIRDTLERNLQGILAGELPCSKATRQSTVDLWLDLHAQDTQDSWVAHRSEDPTALLAGAGMSHEAVMTAEMKLARGDGDRRETLLTLVDLYEQLGDLRSARERLLAALVDQGDSALHERLRRLEDRI
jgi:methylated-DNA-[protein]-cysteine S-methyltransferase